MPARPGERATGLAGAGWLLSLALVLLVAQALAALLPYPAPPRLRAGLGGVWPPAVDGEVGGLRVVTFNIRHGRTEEGLVDLEPVAAVLQRLDPDLAGLQEVDRRRWRSGWVDQPAWLAERLGRRVSFGPALYYTLGEYGNALLSRWPIAEAVTYWLPGRGEQRAVLVARVETPEGPVRVAVTHLGLHPVARQTQVKALADILAADPRLPTVLLGDFNAPPDSPELAPLARLLRFAGGGPSFPASAPAVQPDQIYVSPHWKAVRAWTEPGSPSDHLPVVAELRR